MVVKYVLVIGLFSVLGLSYVMCKTHIFTLAQQVKEQEKKLAQTEEENSKLDLVINQLKSPRELQRKMERKQLVLVVELPHVRMDSGTGANVARTYNPMP